jgi:hypothetical protein
MTKIIAALALFCFACTPPPQPEATAPSTNPSYKVERLFTFEGCTTYKFEDYHDHYYTVCDGSAMVRNEERVKAGKNSTRPQESTTIVVDGGCK